MDRPLVVLDTENATARGAPHLLEVGAVRVVDGEVQDSFESLVCPPVEIDPETAAFHGITDVHCDSTDFADGRFALIAFLEPA